MALHGPRRNQFEDIRIDKPYSRAVRFRVSSESRRILPPGFSPGTSERASAGCVLHPGRLTDGRPSIHNENYRQDRRASGRSDVLVFSLPLGSTSSPSGYPLISPASAIFRFARTYRLASY